MRRGERAQTRRRVPIAREVAGAGTPAAQPSHRKLRALLLLAVPLIGAALFARVRWERARPPGSSRPGYPLTISDACATGRGSSREIRKPTCASGRPISTPVRRTRQRAP